MDLFDDATQNCNFLSFSLKQKFVSINRFIYRIKLTCEVSGKSVANSRKYESPNLLTLFDKEMYARGQAAFLCKSD